ncbi:hypothetical protein SPRG_05679 [Saprolegnia parasitica CBS 223.65]|uniref:Protein kinase domain-containing protein n=1 Tax=Saprolegnia parasitica (strain CBS 223.65) TaxID=695850 RepID=A0A067CE27_SAPPC|nr:hypothetical protein SPRG_05679 [Saprolegnia parasitica CBS 223.65]KDO28718.1 hypothetical protein SPRG_05679 [Saprolegnia parasitica CBS 223.65]|eukprot:XP_012200358.1 hypothetical protein SPRG_05679 [Saprolegnia parasitica CBS 223.65]
MSFAATFTCGAFYCGDDRACSILDRNCTVGSRAIIDNPNLGPMVYLPTSLKALSDAHNRRKSSQERYITRPPEYAWPPSLSSLRVTRTWLPMDAPLPPSLGVFDFTACAWTSVPAAYPWPTNLTNIHLRDSNLEGFSSRQRWPLTLQILDVSLNKMASLDGLSAQLATLNVSGNLLSSVTIGTSYWATTMSTHLSRGCELCLLPGASNFYGIRAANDADTSGAYSEKTWQVIVLVESIMTIVFSCILLFAHCYPRCAPKRLPPLVLDEPMDDGARLVPLRRYRYKRRHIAVKRVRADIASPEVLDAFVQDVALNAILHNPNIVDFVGVYWSPKVGLASLACLVDAHDPTTRPTAADILLVLARLAPIKVPSEHLHGVYRL